MLRLYDYLDSGNGYKVRLLLHRLDLAYERIELDILAGESRTASFLARNPNGRIPLLELPDGSHLAESNAILFYLAEGSDLLPDDRRGRAEALQWMFFEQYSHEPYIAVLRHWCRVGTLDEHASEVDERRARGYAALDVMESRLSDRGYFARDTFSIADIALYAYTHVAHEGGFDLSAHPEVRAWLDRVAAQPRHIPITRG